MASRFKVVPHVALSFTKREMELLKIHFFGFGSHFCPSPNSLRCTKILSQHRPFLSFLPSLFLSCKNTFMDDYDGIKKINGLKYSHSKNVDNF
jgi:hypothetical protein